MTEPSERCASLPRGWQWDRLKDVAEINGRSLAASTDPNFQFDYLDISNVNLRGIVDRLAIEHLYFEDAPSRARRLLSEGATIISSVRPNLQAVAYIAKKDASLVCSTGFNVVTPFPFRFVSKFLYYCLVSENAKQYFCANATGVGYPAVSDKAFGSVEIPIPPRSEQERIAAFLDEKCAAVDKALEIKRKQLESLTEVWQSSLSAITLRGVEDEPLVNTGNSYFPRLPKGWRIERLKRFFNYGKGLNFTKADLTDSGIPVISYGQIHAPTNYDGHLSADLIRFVSQEIADGHESSRLNVGDIVFADTSEDLNGVGNCVVNDMSAEVFAGYHTLIARARFPKHSRYLSYLFQTGEWRKQVRRRACGIKVFSLTQRLLSNVVIVVPPISAQRQIVECLKRKRESLNALSIHLRKQIETLEQYRKSLIHECVTGIRRVV